jgi:hypothetical protein
MSRVYVWIAGPRAWENPKPIHRIVKRLAGTYGIYRLVLVAGGATGVDSLAVDVAQEVGVPLFETKALWHISNHRAGPIRNALIAETFPLKLLVAFHYLELTELNHRGTQNAIKQARKRDIPVKTIRVKPELAIPAAYSELAPGSPNRKAAAKAAKLRRKRQKG